MTPSEKIKYTYENPELLVDSLDLICGDKIGAGCSRVAYEFNFDKRWVVKIAELGSADNFLEYEIWNAVMGTEYKKWFAECGWITDNGRIMLQKRTNEKPKRDRPSKIPSFFHDVKYDNFGWIGNQFTCHDYAFTLDKVFTKALSKKMQKYPQH